MAKSKNRHLSNKPDPLVVTFDALRVSPDATNPVKHTRTDRLTDLIAMLFIFAIAMWIRFWVRQVFIGAYGDVVFRIRTDGQDTLGIGKYLGIEPGTEIESEGYNDYNHYYLAYVDAFTKKGWNPYEGNLVEGDVLNAYVYGPFYMYLIAIGSAFFDLSARESIIWSNLIFDSLSYVMVYVLAKRVTGNVIAMFFGLVGSFSPIAIFFADIRLLNAPQMNFFTLVFIYFYLEHKDHQAVIILAIATLTKQFPLFLAMPFGLFLARRYGILKGISYILMFLLYTVLLSIPWIVLTPKQYFTQLFLPGGGKDFISCPNGGEATNLVHGELDINSCNQYLATKDPSLIMPSDFAIFLDSIVNNHVLFFTSLFLLAWVGFTGYDYLEKNPKLYYRFFAAYMGIAHATIARGIYKYYSTLLIPLFILAFIPGNTIKSFHIRIGATLNRGWSTWIDPKYRIGQATIDYWMYFLFLLGSTLSVFWLLNSALSMFIMGSNYRILWSLLLFLIAIVFLIFPGNIKQRLEIDSVNIIDYQRSNVVIVIVAFIFGLGLNILGRNYFNSNSVLLQTNQQILLGILFLFVSLPYMEYKMTKSINVFKGFQFSLTQFILDVVWILLAFNIMNFFHIEFILIHRYFTTSIILAFSIYFMGLLGSEVWATYFLMPFRAINRYIDLLNGRITFS